MEIDFNKLQWVKNLTKNKIRNPEDAEDVAQEIYARIWKYREKWDPQKGNFDAWVNRVARNVIKDFYKSNQKQQQQEAIINKHLKENPSSKSFEENIEERETISQIIEALDEIQDKNHKQAFILHFLKGWTHAEIAQELDCAKQTPKVWSHRCKKELLKKMKR